MQDLFTGLPTCLKGRQLPGAEARRRLQHDHERRLEAFTQLRALAAQCGVATDPDRDLVTLPEDAISLLELSDPLWARLGEAIRSWRHLLPLRKLEDFGFPAGAENPLEEPNAHLHRIGGGVEAWAFADARDGSVYKFYRPIEGEAKHVGSVFGFRRGDEAQWQAEAHTGDYGGLLEKLLLIQALDGMATEVVAVTPEGILIAKQVLGDPLPQGDDVSGVLPAGLIEIPSRFLRANRDHPRLFFLGSRAWLVADLHARNFVRASDGTLRVIDLVAAPWPVELMRGDGLISEWLERVRSDPAASVLPGAHDDEL
jgi:hypothetical protein